MQRKWFAAEVVNEDVEQAGVKVTHEVSQFNDQAGYYFRISKSYNAETTSYTVTYGDANYNESVEDSFQYLSMLCHDLDLPVKLYERAICLEETANNIHLTAFLECVHVVNPFDPETRTRMETLLGLAAVNIEEAPRSPSITKFSTFSEGTINQPEDYSLTLKK